LLETQKALNGYDLKSKKVSFFPNLQRTEVIRWLIRIIASVIFIKQIFLRFTLGDVKHTNFHGWQHLNQVKQSEITVLKSQNEFRQYEKYH